MLLEEDVAPLLRQRDLGVVALRLAGFVSFLDPELLGRYIYQGRTRYRQATVYRQTILKSLDRPPAETIVAGDGERIRPFWRLLSDYNQTARHEQVDHILTMFRRTFDRRYLPGPARAGLIFATLEGMLGKFRRREDPVQLEGLVAAVVGKETEAVRWFRSAGRGFRNAIAHGRWEGTAAVEANLEQVVTLLRAIVPRFVETWIQVPDKNDKNPAEALIERYARPNEVIDAD